MIDEDNSQWPQNGLWTLCHPWVDPMPYYLNCINDYCKNENPNTLCDAYESYTMACMVTQPYSTAYDR